MTKAKKCGIMVLPKRKESTKMAEKKIKSYGIFNRKTNERVAVISATKTEWDFLKNTCTFYFAKVVIAKISIDTHYVYELL